MQPKITTATGGECCAPGEGAMETKLFVDSRSRRLITSANQKIECGDWLTLNACGMVDARRGEASGQCSARARYLVSPKPKSRWIDAICTAESRNPRQLKLRTRAKQKLMLNRTGAFTGAMKAGLHTTIPSQQSTTVFPQLQIEATHRLLEPLAKGQDVKVKAGYDVMKQKPYCEVRENLLRLRFEPKFWSASLLL